MLEIELKLRNLTKNLYQHVNEFGSRKLSRNLVGKTSKHDYPAATSYLNLIFDRKTVKDIIVRLKKEPMTAFKAKDIFRASELSLLGVSNSHVEKNRDKVKSGEKMSPILLVRYAGKVIIADGYHRMCAVYSLSEDAEIPCKIVSL